EGLARPGDAEQHLVALAGLDALHQFRNRLRLIALRLEFGYDTKGPPALGLVRARRPVRQPRRPVADVGVALLQQRFERIGRYRRSGQAARMAFRRGGLEPGLQGFAKPLRLRLDQSGIEQLGEMLTERMDFGPRGLGLR